MSDTDDLIRRAEDMANVIEYARAARVSPAYTDDTYLRMIRDLLAEVNRLREHLDVLDTDDRVLVRALMAESDAGKAVQRVEALAGDLAAHSRVDPTDPDADVIREAEDSIAHWLRQALKGTDE